MAEGKNDSIILAGQRFKLRGGVKVVTFEDNPQWSFPAAGAGLAVPVFSKRRHPETKKHVKTVKELAGAVSQVLLHTDLTSDSALCFKALLQRSLSTHFMIDWDGTIYQSLDPMFVAYHAGDFNGASIGIDLNNRMKNLEREPGETPYNPNHPQIAEMSKKEFRRGGPERMRINGFWTKAWGYTDPQYQALLELLSVLTSKLDIKPFVPMDEKREVIPTMLMDAAGFEGILGHFHITENRWDPGPAFDWSRVQAGLAREHNSFPVTLVGNDNISNLLEKKKVEAYAQAYYDNNESSEYGGWFPIGYNQNWHGGVHLHPKEEGEPVLAMFDGVIVAARFAKMSGAVGDGNFVLLRHEIDIPSVRKGQNNKLVFYSLYMHLAWMDVVSTPSGDEVIPWVRDLHASKEASDDEEMDKLLDDDDEEEEASEDVDDEEEEEEEEEDYDPGDVDAQVRLLDRVLKTGNRAAFEREQIAKIPWLDSPIKVRSGDPIGQVGRFGPPDEWEPAIHVEIFADTGWDDAIDMGIHRRFFIELEPDLGSDLFVNNRQILALFDADSKQSGAHRAVRQESIADFFNDDDPTTVGAKRNLRMAITRHVSEWSDQVDWVQSLISSEAWGEPPDDWRGTVKRFKKIVRESGIFREALMQVLPYMWLTRDVAEHIGLDVEEWNGVLYHFHPIHFLLWLTYHSSQRIQVVSKGLTLKEIKRRRRKRKKKEAHKEAAEQRHACEIAAVDLADVEASDYRGQLEELIEPKDQGEWRLDWDE